MQVNLKYPKLTTNGYQKFYNDKMINPRNKEHSFLPKKKKKEIKSINMRLLVSKTCLSFILKSFDRLAQ